MDSKSNQILSHWIKLVTQRVESPACCHRKNLDWSASSESRRGPIIIRVSILERSSSTHSSVTNSLDICSVGTQGTQGRPQWPFTSFSVVLLLQHTKPTLFFRQGVLRVLPNWLLVSNGNRCRLVPPSYCLVKSRHSITLDI